MTGKGIGEGAVFQVSYHTHRLMSQALLATYRSLYPAGDTQSS